MCVAWLVLLVCKANMWVMSTCMYVNESAKDFFILLKNSTKFQFFATTFLKVELLSTEQSISRLCMYKLS
jgi:hypothetical protein